MRLVVALSIATFIAISLWVTVGNPASFDLAGVRLLQSLSSPTLDELVAYFTHFGSTPGVIIAVLVTGGWAALRHDRRLALCTLAVGAANELIYSLLKLFQRDRPSEFATFSLPTTFSFPSGHAVSAVAVYGMIAYAFARLHPRSRTPLTIGTPIFALALGLSRPYLGLHWPTDILAGFAVGTLILVGGIRAAGSTSR